MNQAAPRIVIAISLGLAATVSQGQSAAPVAANARPASPVAESLPAHIWLPISITGTIDSRHSQTGQRVVGNLDQHVQIGPKQWIPRGSEVEGKVMSISPDRAGPSGPRITLEFDRVSSKGRTWTLKSRLVAVASLHELYEATMPVDNFDDRGNDNEHAWTMRQIGGDIVYHDSGLIDDPYGQKVGTEDPYGNYALPVARRDGGSGLARTVGLFSTTAEGVYGMPGYSIATDPKTEAIFISAGPDAKNLHLPKGVALLLESEP